MMLYDVPPEQLGAPTTGLLLDDYLLIIDSFSDFIGQSKIVVGFEPGY